MSAMDKAQLTYSGDGLRNRNRCKDTEHLKSNVEHNLLFPHLEQWFISHDEAILSGEEDQLLHDTIGLD